VTGASFQHEIAAAHETVASDPALGKEVDAKLAVAMQALKQAVENKECDITIPAMVLTPWLNRLSAPERETFNHAVDTIELNCTTLRNPKWRLLPPDQQ